MLAVYPGALEGPYHADPAADEENMIKPARWRFKINNICLALKYFVHKIDPHADPHRWQKMTCFCLFYQLDCLNEKSL